MVVCVKCLIHHFTSFHHITGTIDGLTFLLVLQITVLSSSMSRAGGSARVAKVLAFASFGLQILESDMSCIVFTS